MIIRTSAEWWRLLRKDCTKKKYNISKKPLEINPTIRYTEKAVT